MRRLILLFSLLCAGCGTSATYMTDVSVTPISGSDAYCVQAAVREFSSSWYYQRLQTFATEPVLVEAGKEVAVLGKEERSRVVSMKTFIPAKGEDQPANVLIEFRHKDKVLNSTRVLLPLRGD